MANPLKDEEQLYEDLKKRGVVLDPVVWELLNHHIRNDLMVISMAISSLLFTPRWILQTTSFMIKLFHKLTFQQGSPPKGLIEICNITLQRTKSIDTFLKKLKSHTAAE